MKNLMQLITPVVFMLFFVTAGAAQSEKSCDPKDCNVKCCSPKTCTELVNAGICTPEQVAACKSTTSATTKVASMIKVKGETNSGAIACARPTTVATCTKTESKACKPATSKLVLVEKLENQEIKPVTKDQ